MTTLYKFNEVYSGLVVKRPSKSCRTPYVADVEFDGSEFLCHSPSLGCCGLADKESSVILSEMENKKTKCSHRIELTIHTEGENEVVIGINPKLGESIAENALLQGYIQGVKLQTPTSYSRESTYLNSRFDFSGIDENGVEFIMEIKSVPLADYVDVPKKEKKKAKYTELIKTMKFDEKISYFPDGYRKNSTDVVSPRALKHIQELAIISRTTKKRAILCFIVQRKDVMQFQPSNIDLTYKIAVQEAWMNGVEIKTIQVEWSKEGECRYIRSDLPIHLFDTYGPVQK